MKHTAINIALFAGIVAVMFGIQAIDDHGAEHEVAKQELAKQRQLERFETAAREICGTNSSYTVTQGNVLVCKTRRGHKTGQTASL